METNTGSTLNNNNGMDLTELIDAARRRGYDRNLVYSDGVLQCQDTGERFEHDHTWIVESTSVDMGTDPGDDATVYLIESESGAKGYVVVPASIYAEPGKADFIDHLRSNPRSLPR